MQNLKKSNSDIENSSCQWRRVREIGKMVVKEYKLSIMSKFWVANEQHGDYNNTELNT